MYPFSPKGFPDGSLGKESTCSAGDIGMQIRFLGEDDPLEEGMATLSSILALGVLATGHRRSSRSWFFIMETLM